MRRTPALQWPPPPSPARTVRVPADPITAWRQCCRGTRRRRDAQHARCTAVTHPTVLSTSGERFVGSGSRRRRRGERRLRQSDIRARRPDADPTDRPVPQGRELGTINRHRARHRDPSLGSGRGRAKAKTAQRGSQDRSHTDVVGRHTGYGVGACPQPDRLEAAVVLGHAVVLRLLVVEPC